MLVLKTNTPPLDLPGNGTQSQVWETVTFIPFSTQAAQEMGEWFEDHQAPSVAPAQRETAVCLFYLPD